MNLQRWLDRWFPRPTRLLELCLLGSLLLHAGLLAVQWVPQQRLDRLFNVEQLEIILVNALSDTKPPQQAQALSQTNLQGGGQSKQGRTQSPLVHSPRQQAGQEDQGSDAQRLDKIRAQQQLLIASIREELNRIPSPPAGQVANDSQRQRQLMLKQLAELERRIQAENAAPRSRFVGPSTREVAYALYYSEVRHAIESHGTRHFPTEQGKKLYGALTMVITIDAAGRLIDLQIAQSSGDRTLDLKALAIVHGSAPFKVFSDKLRQRADQLALVARFNFTRDGLFNAEVQNP